MQQNIPMKVQEIIRLQTFDINATSYKFGITSMESDKYISIRDQSTVLFFSYFFLIFLQSGESQLTIIEVENNFKFTKKPNKADGALMHPLQNIIALKAKSEVQQGTGNILQVLFRDFVPYIFKRFLTLKKKKKLNPLIFLNLFFIGNGFLLPKLLQLLLPQSGAVILLIKIHNKKLWTG